MTPRYPTYKESGVEWLGQVPEHWQITALKRVAFLQSGSTITAETIEAEGTFPVFGGNGLRGYTEQFTHDGDYSLIGRQGALCGNVNYAQGRFWASEHAIVVSQRKPFAVRWMGELLYVMNLGQYSTSAAQPGIAVEMIGELPVPLPPLPEQTAIAVFLDRETAKIDALVAEQRRLIDLLREKRQAVISHAVTKGLDPNATLKPSGIDWLGDVPEGWEVVPLKRLSPAITVGIVVNPSEYVSEDGLPFIYGGDIREGQIDHKNARRITSENSQRQPKTMLNVGDLLTVRVGAPGVTAVVGEACAGGNCASVMHIKKGHYPSDWLCFALNSRPLRYQVEVVQYGAAQEQFNISHAVEFMVPTPPFEEAEEVARVLGMQAAKLDTLTSTAEAAIALLQERRAALISAAVTGKIDVRHLSPAETEAA